MQFSVKNYRFEKYGNRGTTPEFGNEPSRKAIIPYFVVKLYQELTALKENGKTVYKNGLI